MAVGLVGATHPIPPRDRQPWRLTKRQRAVVAILRNYAEIEDGIGLRLMVDVSFRWSKLFRRSGLSEEATAMRRSFKDRLVFADEAPD